VEQFMLAKELNWLLMSGAAFALAGCPVHTSPQ
jgi:hypothetical protein